MVVEISVVVAADSAHLPLRLIGSLDTQSMSADRFELVILDSGLDADQRTSLQRVTARRPNLRIVEPGEEWVDTLEGRLVLKADPDQKLFPEALERLTTFAAEHGLEVVAGRAVQPRQPLGAPFLADDAQLAGEEAAAALRSTVLLTTKERARATPTGLDVDTDGARVGVYASYPATDERVLPQTAVAEITHTVGAAIMTWEGTDLLVNLSGDVTSGGVSGLSPALVVRQIGTHLSFLVPAEGHVGSSDDAEGGVGWGLTTRLSVLTGAAGAPLPPGLWELDVVLGGSAGTSAPVTVRASPVSAALLPGEVVTSGLSQLGTFQLDVGATKFPPVVQADAADATVTESFRGTVLRLRLPAINVETTEPASGSIGLGRLKLPASIETASGTAIFTAFVSGLVGTVPVAAHFGRSGLQSTGISLQISGAGQMTAIPTPPEPAKPPDANPAKSAATSKAASKPKAAGKPKAGGKPKAAPKPARGPLANLRRAVPAPLEPLARKVAGSPLARRAYRRLTGLAR